MFLIPLEEIPNIKKTKKNFDLSKKTEKEIFFDMCFCLCAPQTKWTSNREAQAKLKELDFFSKDITLETLENILKKTRFFRNKAQSLIEAKSKFKEVLKIVFDSTMVSSAKRNSLISLLNGCGPKVASHFLRNLGFEDLAIVDTHILKFLECPRPASKRDYAKLEERLTEIAQANCVSIAELDMYVWKAYSNTPWSEFLM